MVLKSNRKSGCNFKINKTKDKIDSIIDLDTGEVLQEDYRINIYDKPQMYLDDKLKGIEPMTAKEYLNDTELEEMLTSNKYYAQEKLDGTRCTLHTSPLHNRLFSRRISKKTGWYAENTDSVPHIKNHTRKSVGYTILDGEMRIDGKEFKHVSSTLNCNWDLAIEKQQEYGFITYHAFDIIQYKGVYVAKKPLEERLVLLKKIIKELNCQWIVEEAYTDDTIFVPITKTLQDEIVKDEDTFKNKYSELYGCLEFLLRDTELFTEKEVMLTKKAWYEYILLHGGEGLMLKPKNGTYRHTRGREYTKLKKFDTWDCVVLGYVPPTKIYTGSEIDTWKYWYHAESDSFIEHEGNPSSGIDECVPVTKHFFNNWIGTIIIGVKVTSEDLEHWKKNNPKEKEEIYKRLDDNSVNFDSYLVVGEISGFDEETRERITKNQIKYLGETIEIKAQEVLKTGKMRHPRFLRFREDKEAKRCTYKDHMRL